MIAFNNDDRVLAVYLNLENAFDRTWRRLINSLIAMDINGYVLKFIVNFLSDRYFRVRCSTTDSKEFIQENGVPQGCVFSAMLICIRL